MRIAQPPLRTVMRFGWLVVLGVLILGHDGDSAFAWVLFAVAAVGWLGWTLARHRLAFLVVLGVAGALLALVATAAVGFLAAAGVAAGSLFDQRRAVVIALCGPVALGVGSAIHGWSNDLVFGGTAAALAGLVGGLSRRQAEQRTQQAARTELARELHDVLAHTLSALAVQLEAAEAVLEAGGSHEKLHELLGRSRSLVTTGIDEAAGVVQALRDEPVAIADRLAELAAAEPVPLRVEGTPRVLPPDAGLALYRAAQEALTNARKHAPGAPRQVSLAFRERTTVVTVTNGPPAAAGSGAGSGLGLQGMRERLELAGGRLETDDSATGFRVEATVPA